MMASSTPSTIKIKSKYEWTQKEKLAAAAVTPGKLLEVTAADKFKHHATAGGVNQKAFAIENAMIGDDIDTDYSSGNQVHAIYAQPGDEVYAYFLDSTTAANPTKFAQSDGSGNLKTVDTTTPSSTGDRVIVGRFLESVATTATATRIKLEVL